MSTERRERVGERECKEEGGEREREREREGAREGARGGEKEGTREGGGGKCYLSLCRTPLHLATSHASSKVLV